MPSTPRPPIWLHSDRFLARRLGRPVQRFLDVEASGGLVLLAGTVVALLWANSPWSASYRDLWETVLSFDLGGHVVEEDLRHWVNDGLMALFFFVVGLEIKQELVDGQLSKVRDALLPAVAAIGGMVVPAVIFTAVNAGGDGAKGWGIPMATDIAFAVGVLALFGSRVPQGLKVLLLALAIVDDIGAIVVIAIFYSDELQLGWIVAAVAGLALIVVLRVLRVWYAPLYAAIGVVVWFATLQSGVHATIAGVAVGLLAPARPLLPDVQAAAIADRLSDDRSVTVEEVRDVSFRLRGSVSVAERLQDLLHPWTSYVVIPLFALANAGIDLSGGVVRDAVTSPVTAGVVAGLVIGKFVGIGGAVLLATKLGRASLPDEVTPRQIAGVAALGGIGFTVSLFISGLAFAPPLTDDAKIGVLTASVLGALAGSLILRSALPPAGRPPGAQAGNPEAASDVRLQR